MYTLMGLKPLVGRQAIKQTRKQKTYVPDKCYEGKKAGKRNVKCPGLCELLGRMAGRASLRWHVGKTQKEVGASCAGVGENTVSEKVLNANHR